MDKKVEEYIKKQPDNEKNILNSARELILKTFPNVMNFFNGALFVIAVERYIWQP